MAVTEILVLRALGLGDLLVAVPALRALRTGFPEARITLAAPEPLHELADLIDAVDVLLPTARLGALRWPGARPEIAVNLHGCGPESVADLLATHPRRLFAHRHPDFSRLDGPHWRESLHEVDRWCRLLQYHGIPADRDDLGLRRPDLPSLAPGAVVVHPGAAFAARQWPTGHYGAVAKALANDGHRVVLTGGPAERALVDRVAAMAGVADRDVFAGHTGLAQLTALVADATFVVCGDTGIAHLATACGTPSVLLFGPTPPHRWGPPPGRAQHVVLWAGQVGDPFGEQPDSGLLRITAAEVLVAAEHAMRMDPRPCVQTITAGGVRHG